MFLKIKLFFKNLLQQWFGPNQADDELLITLLKSDTKPLPLDERDLAELDTIVKEFVRTQRVDWDNVQVSETRNPKLYRVVNLFKSELIDATEYFTAIDFIYTRYPELLDVGTDF